MLTLLPGLIDTHQHLCFDGNGTLEEMVAGVSDEALLERARVNARRALAAGITTIRDLGDRGFVTLALRDDPDLPTILASGPPLTADGGHCWFLGGCCTDRDALLAAVAERKTRACDVVKVMVTGGALTPAHPMWVSQFSAEDLAAAVTAAHDAGLPVAAHCHGVEGTAFAIDAGVDTIEHCTFFTDEGRSVPDMALIDRLAESDVVVSATFGTDPSHPVPPLIAANLDTIIGAIGTLHGRGGSVVVGTDAGIGPGKPHDVLPHAVRHLLSAGFTLPEALRAMTSGAAAAIGLGRQKGFIRPGFDADMLAVDGDPTVDPEALFRVRGVWRAGRRVVG